MPGILIFRRSAPHRAHRAAKNIERAGWMPSRRMPGIRSVTYRSPAILAETIGFFAGRRTSIWTVVKQTGHQKRLDGLCPSDPQNRKTKGLATDQVATIVHSYLHAFSCKSRSAPNPCTLVYSFRVRRAADCPGNRQAI